MWRFGLFVVLLIMIIMVCSVLGWLAGKQDALNHIDTLAWRTYRLRSMHERQRYLRDLTFYTYTIDGIRGEKTIAAETLYEEWFGYCMAAGHRVDPNIVYWKPGNNDDNI